MDSIHHGKTLFPSKSEGKTQATSTLHLGGKLKLWSVTFFRGPFAPPRPEVQTVPGYSSLMSTRMGVEESPVTRPPAPVSVASRYTIE